MAYDNQALVNEALKRGAKTVYAGTRGGMQITDRRARSGALVPKLTHYLEVCLILGWL
jgi:hypothetical protein